MQYLSGERHGTLQAKMEQEGETLDCESDEKWL